MINGKQKKMIKKKFLPGYANRTWKNCSQWLERVMLWSRHQLVRTRLQQTFLEWDMVEFFFSFVSVGIVVLFQHLVKHNATKIFTNICFRCHITVSHGGHCNDCPPQSEWYTFKLVIRIILQKVNNKNYFYVASVPSYRVSDVYKSTWNVVPRYDL